MLPGFIERLGVAETIVQYQFVLNHLHLLRGRLVADIGIGPHPSLWYMLNSAGFHCAGIDKVARVKSVWFNKTDITTAHQLRPAFDGVFCLDVLHAIEDADRAVINMIKSVKAGGIVFIAVPYSFHGNYKAGKTRVYSKKDIHRWCRMIGKVIDMKYWRVWTGDKWRAGDRLSFPETCFKKYADMVAIAVQVPIPPEEFQDDMVRCNYKLDDGWNRYYGEGWQDFKDRINWVIENVTKPPVLDLGCGPGVITNELRKKGLPALGVDYSDKMVRIAQSRGTNVLWGSAEKIPCKENSFNTVVVTETLEHVNDLGQTCEEIGRVLKPGGEIVITVPNGGNTNRFHLRTFTPEDFKSFRWKVESCEVFKEWILVKCRK